MDLSCAVSSCLVYLDNMKMNEQSLSSAQDNVSYPQCVLGLRELELYTGLNDAMKTILQLFKRIVA